MRYDTMRCETTCIFIYDALIRCGRVGRARLISSAEAAIHPAASNELLRAEFSICSAHIHSAAARSDRMGIAHVMRHTFPSINPYLSARRQTAASSSRLVSSRLVSNERSLAALKSRITLATHSTPLHSSRASQTPNSAALHCKHTILYSTVQCDTIQYKTILSLRSFVLYITVYCQRSNQLVRKRNSNSSIVTAEHCTLLHSHSFPSIALECIHTYTVL